MYEYIKGSHCLTRSVSCEMDRWKGKVAIVTGASCGIGAAVAAKLAKAGLNVVGFARRPHLIEEHAKELAGCSGKLYARKVDMTLEDEIIAGFQWATKNVGPVHVLINNAAVMETTGLAEGDTKCWKTVLDTNVLGVAIATREAYKIMSANKIDGHIVQINSIVGHKVVFMPGLGLYGASKFAITSYHEALRQEFNQLGSKIKLSSISPGAVKTNFLDNTPASMQEMMKAMPFLNADDVADAIVYVLGTPPHVQIHELTMQVLGEQF